MTGETAADRTDPALQAVRSEIAVTSKADEDRDKRCPCIVFRPWGGMSRTAKAVRRERDPHILMLYAYDSEKSYPPGERAGRTNDGDITEMNLRNELAI